jgi:uncharacterized membrane-anchored protein
MPFIDLTAFVAELDHCISYILISVFYNLMYIIYPHFTVYFSTEKNKPLTVYSILVTRNSILIWLIDFPANQFAG